MAEVDEIKRSPTFFWSTETPYNGFYGWAHGYFGHIAKSGKIELRRLELHGCASHPPGRYSATGGGSRTCFGAVCATQRPPHPAKPPKTWFLRPSTEARLGARLHVGLVASESSAGTPAPQSTDFHTA